MTRDELKAIFGERYSPENYKHLVWKLFPTCKLFNAPVVQEDLSVTQKETAKAITQLGTCTLGDDSKIIFYQVELVAGKKVAHNRVGLRNLLVGELQPGDLDGILASFYNPDTHSWRISFISESLSWDHEMKQLKTETSRRRYTFVVGQSEAVATALERFQVLAQKAGTIGLADILQAFSVEKMSDEFFAQYRHHFESFVEYLVDSDHLAWFKSKAKELHAENVKEEASGLARNFVKKLLGRIVFLYFLQKKGWLGVPRDGQWGEGQRDFVGALFKGFEPKNNFFTECLVPLFFKTLNTRRKGDIFDITETRVPYLNGGLFDQDPIEPTELKFKSKLFEDLLTFFDSYNFTIDENSPEDQDIGIDPEMLGRIFENLLEENLRSKKGTFYTPKDVVHYMCRESLRCHVREKLGDKAAPNELKAIDAFIYQLNELNSEPVRKHAAEIDAALTNVKICDPAIGSGAFPMGMVYEILRLKKELFGYLPNRKTFDYGQEKLAIIRNSIYGVDIDQGAIDIARLRFWLSLIVDEEEPKPLPNLDYRIMQGDSLREWFEGLPLEKLIDDGQGAPITGGPKQPLLGDIFKKPEKQLTLSIDAKAQLKDLVSQYFEVENADEKKRIHKEIDAIVDRHLKSNVQHEKNLCLKIIKGHEDEIRKIEQLPLTQRQPSAKQYEKHKKSIKQEKDKLKELEEKEDRLIELEDSIEKPFFLWHLFFNDVLVDNKGFDIVIGNPPYGVKVDDETESYYKLGSKDSYGVFMSMALKKLVKMNGTLCFIVSDTWLTIKSHLPLRKQLLDWQLQKVMRLHQDCFHATVNSCIITVRKEKFDPEKPNKVIAADYTNISTRKETAKFREKLVGVVDLVGESTVEYGVYEYEQGLLFSNSNVPVAIGSPKLFLLLNDTTSDNEKRKLNNDKEILVRKICFNDKELELVKFGDVAEVKQGLATGDNEYYLYQNPQARGSYKDINQSKQFLLTEEDLNKIRDDEDLRLRVIEKGIHKTKVEKNFEKDRYFEGRFIVPYDKGGESDTESGWLPNYYVPTDYFIDWSTTAIRRLKTYKIADRIKDRNEDKVVKENYLTTNAAVIRNQDTYFSGGITFSRTGIYAPSFRLNHASPYDTEGSTIFLSSTNSFNTSLCILSSRLFRFLLKNYIGHTVHAQVEELKEAPFICADSSEINHLVEKLIQKQRLKHSYDYFSNEQKQLDCLVYQLYNLSLSDINEVETWFARRYPKLAKYADIKPLEKLKPQAADQDQKIAHYQALIAGGESRTVEFKQTLRYDVREKKVNKDLEWTCLKNIAAFLNSQGGTLFIGVRDEDGAITGIDDDYSTFAGENKKDAFLRHLDNLIDDNFGNAIHDLLSIEFPLIEGKTVCAINILGTASAPVYLENKQKNNQEEFYIRRSASTVALTMREMMQFVQEHWKKSDQKEIIKGMERNE